MFNKYISTVAILWFAIVSVVNSQDNFVNTIFSNTVCRGYQFVQHNDRIFIASGKVINNREASEVKEVNDKGEVLWTRDIPWLDISRQTMLFDNGCLLLASNTYDDLKSVAIYKMSLDGDSLDVYRISDLDSQCNSIWTQKLLVYNDKYVITGRAICNDSMYTKLFVMQKDGVLDTVISVVPSNADSKCIDALVDIENRLNVFIRYREAWGDGIRIVKKYNSDWEEVFSYTSEPEYFNYSSPYATEIVNNRIAYVSGHVKEKPSAIQGIRRLNSIRTLNEDGSVSWQFKYPDEPSYRREMVFMHTLTNGNILSGGIYSTGLTEPPIINVPFIVCVSPDGEFLWERAYVQHDMDGDTRLGVIADVLELDNGDLLLLGFLTEEGNQNILLMRTDSEGCVIDSCDPVSEIVGVDDIEAGNEAIHIYPNPITANFINIECTVAQDEHLIAKLYDITGRFVSETRLHDGINTIDIATETSGILIAVIEKNGLIIERKKILRL